MAPLLYVVVLFYQTVSTDAECTVPGCNPTSCDGNNCTQCIDPYYLTSHDTCSQCFLPCRKCGDNVCYRCAIPSCVYACSFADCPFSCPGVQNVGCPNCPDGFYKISSMSHCFRCLSAGCKCSLASNCIGCLPGRYDTSSNCEHACPSECFTCISANNCSKCVTGKYGPACASDCISQCQDDSCDKVSGICPSGCPDNWYLDSNKVCRICPDRCGRCTNFSHCNSCSSPHYWGPVCERDCIGCVDDCSKGRGCISGCLSRYYSKYNDNLHGHECLRCPETCKSCNNARQCTVCLTGHWGNICQQNCSGCEASCNINNGCSSGCLPGYYERMINGGIQCEKCPNNCVSCSDFDTCKECRSGYYAPDEANCIMCPDNCLGSNCFTHNGICMNGCVNGWTGHQCNLKCPPGCLLCEQFNSSHCSSCKIEFYGNSCENNCSVHCKQTEEHNTCHKTDGSCINGCESGYWGQHCNSPCGLGCYGNQCNETTGICYSGCKKTFSGNQCNQKCIHVQDVSADQHKHVDTEDNTSQTTTVVALSVVAGVAVVVAAISITGNVILLKRGRMGKKITGSMSANEDQELDTNTYQDLNRTESADEAYSSVIQDYPNTS